MGERAVARITGPDVSYWYRSRWGARDAVLDAVFAADSPAKRLATVDWRPVTATRGRQPDAQTTEIVYHIGRDGVAIFVPLWFGTGLFEPPSGSTDGVLVPATSLSEVRRIRRHHRQLKEQVVDAVAAGFTPESARRLSRRIAVLVETVAVQFRRAASFYIG
ncbi:hypothetical protein SAMN05216226_106187 [Halovenus aranensis]|jgi:hypothetical protein|uniref:Uncharacterized protein n=1 Tax=Halovenus aranensis TaxID=890420 RepID=A0A1G8VEW3_9EURY|nr:hypothetical protein [Halovenus aranensis]SDJ64583.1 hypothetical protein SAMN05216226_106187 [Halovenus aranensis]